MKNNWTRRLEGNNSQVGRDLGGISRGTVNAWKQGIAYPSPDMQRKILDTYSDVTAAHILEHYEHARAGKEPVEVPSE